MVTILVGQKNMGKIKRIYGVEYY
jgi:hypothetical protein